MKPNRQAILEKYANRCGYCGIPITLKEMQVDHIIPQYWIECNQATKEQVYCIDNLMPACRSCNGFKDTFSLETFRSEVSEQPNRLRKYKHTFRLAERFGLISCTPKPIVFWFEKYELEHTNK